MNCNKDDFNCGAIVRTVEHDLRTKALDHSKIYIMGLREGRKFDILIPNTCNPQSIGHFLKEKGYSVAVEIARNRLEGSKIGLSLALRNDLQSAVKVVKFLVYAYNRKARFVLMVGVGFEEIEDETFGRLALFRKHAGEVPQAVPVTNGEEQDAPERFDTLENGLAYQWYFRSRSNTSNVYTVKYNRQGILSCNCKGWIFRRECWHTRYLLDRGVPEESLERVVREVRNVGGGRIARVDGNGNVIERTPSDAPHEEGGL